MIRNIKHLMKSLRESFVPQKRATEAFNYPGYVKRLQKNDKYRQKLKICTKNYARKRCPPNQLNIKLTTKNNKNLCLHFLKVTKLENQMTPIIIIP